MNTYLKNPEIKAFMIKLLLIHIIFAALILLFAGIKISTINKNIINENTNLIGQILYKHPELENDIIHTVTKTANQKEINISKKVLKSYGYDENMPIKEQPVLKGLVANLQFTILLLTIIYFLPLTILAFFEYRKIYTKVRVLSSAAEGVIDGNFKMVKSNNEEGDFALLTCNFNNMSNRLKLSLEGLKNDKLFFKNIISDISHQLKTPLSSLSAMNEILLENENISAKDSKDFLEKSRSQLDRMEWLIINLLKMARLEAGAIKFKVEKFPIVNSINKSVSSLILKANEKHIHIDIIGDKNIYLSGDEEWIAEALTNIIKNSIEHTNANGQITIQFTETNIYSSIVIEDNGEGIDKKDLPHIFQRFYKGVSTVKTESVGIGLALSKLIIEGQNGSISVTSEKNRGTKFTITFLKFVI